MELLRSAWDWLPVRGRVGLVLLAFAQLYWVRWFIVHYVVLPVRLYRSNVIDARDRTRTIEPAYPEPMEPEVARHLEESERSLLALGFVDPHRTTDQLTVPLTSVGCTLEHSKSGDHVLIIAICSTAGLTRRFNGELSFSAEFVDGVRLCTSNIRTARYWPDAPKVEHVRFTDVTEVDELYRLHRARVEARRATVPQKSVSRGRTPEQRLVHTKRLALDFRKHLVRCGYRRRTPGGLRPTVRGALFSAWRHVFPWRHIDAWSLRRRARAAARLA